MTSDQFIPAPTDLPSRPGRRWPAAIGLALAVALVPIGLAMSWTAAWLGNCEWGFFGETGPAYDAEAFTWNDLGVQSIGLLIAVVPWAVIAWRTRRPDRRQAALAIIAVSVAIVTIAVLAPQILYPETFWSSTCT